MIGILDRYLLREWTKIFVITLLGFPLVAIILELTDKLDEYLSRGLESGDIALSYVFSLPEKAFLVLPASVLFATVFSISTMSRHSEITAAKASGRSFHRLVLPVLAAALAAAGVGLVLGELAPILKGRQLELLGEREIRSQPTRYNFVYRADQGWVYAVRSLDITERELRDPVLERAGTGPEYPTLIVQAGRGVWTDSTRGWLLTDGRLRLITGPGPDVSFSFDSARVRSLVETPTALLAEPKNPDEMRFSELRRYIGWLERSGGDVRKLRVDLALKLAIPFTCIVIAMFAAPLAITNPKAGGAVGVGIGLGTTVVFLTLVQLSKAVGAGGVLPSTLAAWMPNLLFGAAGAWLAWRAPT
ncbi:MAG TPA: LptF/LptG family permease [Gemmatimonadales bacterium]|nr:LptF/LptG family permease [Gemmatimonadales bacterium]